MAQELGASEQDKNVGYFLIWRKSKIGQLFCKGIPIFEREIRLLMYYFSRQVTLLFPL